MWHSWDVTAGVLYRPAGLIRERNMHGIMFIISKVLLMFCKFSFALFYTWSTLSLCSSNFQQYGCRVHRLTEPECHSIINNVFDIVKIIPFVQHMQTRTSPFPLEFSNIQFVLQVLCRVIIKVKLSEIFAHRQEFVWTGVLMLDQNTLSYWPASGRSPASIWLDTKKPYKLSSLLIVWARSPRLDHDRFRLVLSY